MTRYAACEKEHAMEILSLIGYNYALSDTQYACKVLGHPELKPTDPENYHKWAEPFPRRCYCGAIGYTDAGRFCAVKSSHPEVMKKLFPGWRENFGKRVVEEE